MIAPADNGAPAGALPAPVLPIGGALAGLGLGCLIAVLLERLGGRVRSADEVELAGVRVLAVAPESIPGARLIRGRHAADFDATIRRLRAHVLELDPRPEIITVAPVGTGRSDGLVSEALAESFAKAGPPRRAGPHRRPAGRRPRGRGRRSGRGPAARAAERARPAAAQHRAPAQPAARRAGCPRRRSDLLTSDRLRVGCSSRWSGSVTSSWSSLPAPGPSRARRSSAPPTWGSSSSTWDAAACATWRPSWSAGRAAGPTSPASSSDVAAVGTPDDAKSRLRRAAARDRPRPSRPRRGRARGAVRRHHSLTGDGGRRRRDSSRSWPDEGRRASSARRSPPCPASCSSSSSPTASPPPSRARSSPPPRPS